MIIESEFPPGLEPNPISRAAPKPQKILALTIFLIVGMPLGMVINLSLESMIFNNKINTKSNRQKIISLDLHNSISNDTQIAQKRTFGSGHGGTSIPFVKTITISSMVPEIDAAPLSTASIQIELNQINATARTNSNNPAVSYGNGSGKELGTGAGFGAGNRGVKKVEKKYTIDHINGKYIVALESLTILNKVTPRYPMIAMLSRIEGTVTARISFDEKGIPFATEFVDGKPVFFPCIQEVVPDWLFKPVQREGKPVKAIVEITFVFSIAWNQKAHNP